jgi:hypothetical protein
MANQMPGLSIAGIPELQQLMRDLGPRMLGEGLKAMRKAMAPIVKDAKRRISIGWGYGSGQLKKSLGVLYAKVYKNRQRAIIKIGPRFGFDTTTTTERTFNGKKRRGSVRIRQRKHNPKFIAHLVEFGHRIAVGGKLDFFKGSKKKGTLTQVAAIGMQQGSVKPMPFLRPAFDSHRSQAIATLISELKISFLKIHAKQSARRAAA